MLAPQLEMACSQLVSVPLPFDRPLWQWHVFQNYRPTAGTSYPQTVQQLNDSPYGCLTLTHIRITDFIAVWFTLRRCTSGGYVVLSV